MTTLRRPHCKYNISASEMLRKDSEEWHCSRLLNVRIAAHHRHCTSAVWASENRRKMTLPTRLLVILIPGRSVSMKNLFDATVANQLKTRLGKLEPQSERRWGKMTAAQIWHIAR